MSKFICASAIFLIGGCGPSKLDSDLFSQMRSQYGHVEIAGSYLRFHERTNRQELKEFTGVDPVTTEWCAAFINAVLEESNMPTSSTVSDHPLLAKSFMEWGTEVKYGQVGDIAVFDRCCEQWKGHVGIIVGVNIVNNRIYYDILGGNQDNTVSIKTYAKSSTIAIRRYTSPKLINNTVR